ncbi:hypothetical protein ELH26_09105 [Rhizobium leguminosarum]|uniref:hypothetical protein n=1 Tax=Rhizobium leguminosarum TaxID=384 RepID=UPI0010319EA6|nr:hypothetical protein [Rhizobium leguminosarum]TBC94159.1 hypothetical protein ELH26_09105 [Rhizobium leguminosarum]
MKVDIDLEGVLTSAQEMPEEITSIEDVPEGLREFYKQNGDRLKLDHAQRDALVANVSRALEDNKLRGENNQLKDESNRRRVVETVREQLARFVKPELMPGAVALFMSQHKFGLKDGKVVVVGRRGREEAEMAAVNWIAEDGEAYAAPARAEAGGFAAEVARLKNLH